MTTITRRAALGGALVSSVALAIPAGEALGGRNDLQATLPPENAKRPPQSIAGHAKAISDLLQASGDNCGVFITAERYTIDFHPGRNLDSSTRVVELMRQLAAALHDFGGGVDQFRAIVEPDGAMWLQGTDQPRLTPQLGQREHLVLILADGAAGDGKVALTVRGEGYAVARRIEREA